MSTTIIDNFSLKCKKYLDERQSVETVAELKAIGKSIIPDGFCVYCKETKKWYEYNSANTEDEILGKWRYILESVEGKLQVVKDAATDAKSVADKADATAYTANATANTAKSTADTANTNANTAKTTANTAKTAADNATTAISELMLRIKELERDVWPLVLTAQAQPNIVEVNTRTDVCFTFEATFKGEDIVRKCEFSFNVPAGCSSLSGINYNVFAGSINRSAVGLMTLGVTGVSSGRTATIGVDVNVVHPSFVGFSASADPLSIVKNTNKLLLATAAGSIVAPGDGKGLYIHIIYPKAYGMLSCIRDVNNVDILGSFNRTETLQAGVTFYCYVLKTPLPLVNSGDKFSFS